MGQLSSKCIQIPYSGFFEVADHEYHAYNSLGPTWGTLCPGLGVIYGEFGSLTPKCDQIRYSWVFKAAAHEYRAQKDLGDGAPWRRRHLRGIRPIIAEMRPKS